MKLKTTPITIPEENPFAEDKLDRKENAEILTQLIFTCKGPFVLAIDSPWGTGKTTFIRMWQKSLEKMSYSCLYYNAWENDFSDDPLVSLIGEFESGLDSLSSGEKKKSKEIFEKVKNTGANLIKKSLPLAIKLATSGLIDLNNFSEESIATFAEDLAKEKIEKYEQDKKTIVKFRKNLGEFAKSLYKNKDEEAEPLIIFIDELDRCRPVFALELLEKAKHFFNTEGIVFVLAIDKEQLGYSIKSIYGSGMDVDGYLRRFIDLDYRLPELKNDVFCDSLFDKFGLKEYLSERTTKGARYEKNQFLSVFCKLSSIFKLSLRVQEQCFSRLSLVFRTTPKNYFFYPTLLATLIVLKAINPKLYYEYIKKISKGEDIVRYIKETSGGESFFEDNYGEFLEAELICAQMDRTEMRDLMTHYKKLSEDLLKSEYEREKALIFSGKLQSINSDDSYGKIDYIARKIEITERFVSL